MVGHRMKLALKVDEANETTSLKRLGADGRVNLIRACCCKEYLSEHE